MLKTKHNLPFEVAEWETGKILDPNSTFRVFRVGTVGGLWDSTDTTYDVLAFLNEQPGNGHLEDVFEWFFSSCKRDNKDLRVLELWNKRFKAYLMREHEFVEQGENLIKIFRK